jgi:hypothetical protein
MVGATFSSPPPTIPTTNPGRGRFIAPTPDLSGERSDELVPIIDKAEPAFYNTRDELVLLCKKQELYT